MKKNDESDFVIHGKLATTITLTDYTVQQIIHPRLLCRKKLEKIY